MSKKGKGKGGKGKGKGKGNKKEEIPIDPEFEKLDINGLNEKIGILKEK